MKTDLVSIITPCYNSALYIKDTIESVINQTYENWEMLICDDCSIDNSAEIILSYCNKDNRIKYLKTTTPSGSPTEPRNMGIRKANGRFIAFLDSDDLWFPSKLQKQLETFNNYPNTAIVYSYYEKINEKGVRNNRIVKSPKRITYKHLLYGNVIGNLTGMYDTSKVGKIMMKHIGHEDYAMWLEILKKGYCGINSLSVEALYRVRTSSISSNKLKTLTWTWNIYRNIEGLNFIKSLYYFVCHEFKSILKKFI